MWRLLFLDELITADTTVWYASGRVPDTLQTLSHFPLKTAVGTFVAPILYRRLWGVREAKELAEGCTANAFIRQ